MRWSMTGTRIDLGIVVPCAVVPAGPYSVTIRRLTQLQILSRGASVHGGAANRCSGTGTRDREITWAFL